MSVCVPVRFLPEKRNARVRDQVFCPGTSAVEPDHCLRRCVPFVKCALQAQSVLVARGGLRQFEQFSEKEMRKWTRP
jgi:hypothetical protein